MIDGYNTRFWYWEFIVMFRKFAIAGASVYLSSRTTIGGKYRVGHLSFLIFLFFYFLHQKCKPYKDDNLNFLEALGLYITTITYVRILFDNFFFFSYSKLYFVCVVLRIIYLFIQIRQ